MRSIALYTYLMMALICDVCVSVCVYLREACYSAAVVCAAILYWAIVDEVMMMSFKRRVTKYDNSNIGFHTHLSLALFYGDIFKSIICGIYYAVYLRPVLCADI